MDNPQDPNQITPSTPEQVQVVQQPEASAQPEQPPAETPPVSQAATGYDAFTDDDFRNAYTALCTQMGREFGIRHDLITENGVSDTTKFRNVLVVAKKE